MRIEFINLILIVLLILALIYTYRLILTLTFHKAMLSIREDIKNYSNENNINYKSIKPVIDYVEKAIKNSDRFSLFSFFVTSKILKGYNLEENDIDKKIKLLPKEQKEYFTKKVDDISFRIFKYMLHKLSVMSILLYVYILFSYIKYYSKDKAERVSHIIFNRLMTKDNLIRSIEGIDSKNIAQLN